MGKKMKVEHNIRDTSHQSGRKTTKKPAAKPKPSKSQQPKEAPSSTAESNTISALLPMPLQQRILSTFNAAYNPVLTSHSLGEILQEVKAALYARDFDAAFAKARPEALDAYAARWSPTRALGYAAVFLGIEEYLEELETEVKVEAKAEGETKAEDGAEAGAVTEAEETGDAHQDVVLSSEDQTVGTTGSSGDDGPSAAAAAADDDQVVPASAAEGENVTPPPPAETETTTPTAPTEPTTDTPKPSTELTKSIRMLSIGGGAAEIAAFAAYLSQQPSRSLGGTMALLDSAPWDDAVAKLHDALTTPPPLSKYANAAAKAANMAIIEADRLTSSFTQQDVLSMTRDQLSQKLGNEPLIVTLLFTLNELYTTAGIGKTTAFLLDLTATVPLGSLLLVVDSPGSYSEAAVGKESKKYPMQWLMDHTLATKPEKEGVVEGCRWEKLESHDSVWFRLADSLKYPIPLENMRYQMHLYRATKP
ncbi:25S rRNA (uridine(2843)-N(3))-methyltransferase [Colletotrichum spaethianum]|uniref:25S rRNA (Uridine(2843)-N(3))-methyltransferase n=1 Tax=Colletotrichum spaethianum TaxID=700344 RepID=A0AA37LEH8_9PEZI|nr:25S rRNA (uridine(2843)-N(3))-methyltransferase [Colletotrichum spaethianum]GKT44969.1 25S rRNA (uridine(2843)-N(3))-methyltransferase [Colletotrichum spaethianum]